MPGFDELPPAERLHRMERLARKALAAYRLEEAELTLVSAEPSTLFHVRDRSGGRFALRIGPSGQEGDKLRLELRWLSALRRDTALIVPEPILSSGGDPLQHLSTQGVPGFRFCVLFRWVEGRPLRDTLSDAQSQQIGGLLALLHEHAASFRLPSDLKLPRLVGAWEEEGIDPVCLPGGERGEAAALLGTWRQRIEDALSALGEGPEVAGVIHGAVDRGSLLTCGERTGIVGFGGCAWGYYLYDLAICVRSLAGRPDDAAQRAALLEGYEARRRLPQDVERLLTTFEALSVILEWHRCAEATSSRHPTSSEQTPRLLAKLRAIPG